MNIFNKINREKGEIVAAALTIVAAGLIATGLLTGSYIVQKTNPKFNTTAAGSSYNKNCTLPIPNGCCDMKEPEKGTVKFYATLNCGGSAANCPGGPDKVYTIAHRWGRCKKAGKEPCGEWCGSDYIEPGDLSGAGPWTIKGQSKIEWGNAEFPVPDCGRIQVDVQITDNGKTITDPAGKVYNTGKDCDGGGITPLPTNTPKPTSTPIAGAATNTPTPTSTPTPTPVISCNSKKGICQPIRCLPILQTIIPNISCPPFSIPFVDIPQVCCTKPLAPQPTPTLIPTSTPTPTTNPICSSSPCNSKSYPCPYTFDAQCLICPQCQQPAQPTSTPIPGAATNTPTPTPTPTPPPGTPATEQNRTPQLQFFNPPPQ